MYHTGSDKDWRAESFLHNSQWREGSTFTKLNGSSLKQVNIKIMNDWNCGRNPLGSIFSRSIVKLPETNEDQFFLAELQKSEKSPVLHLKRCALKVRPLEAVKPLEMGGISERRTLDACLNERLECEGGIRHLGVDLPRRAVAHAQASKLEFWSHKKGFGRKVSKVQHKSNRLAEGYLKSLLLQAMSKFQELRNFTEKWKSCPYKTTVIGKVFCMI
ncbi:uncharacterized protein LOC103175075 [Callorhinchus milii]|uniref:uncharacterized protein LOC103175075 n=1 Tax=Callorhinchus milii TaxID=7868 RepID=UPI001C3F802C|nr:uncharacterized protein LOC103175075 [Callorhinchus milii]